MYGYNWQQDSNRHKSHRSYGSTGAGNTGTGNTGTTKNGTQITNLVGEFVRINRGGPDSLEGKLLAVKSDYLVLSTREGVVYVDLDHVKSVTGFAKAKSGGTSNDYINANNFRGVITALTKEFVQINWGGPERVQGFLAEVQGNTALVVVNNEVVYVLVDHIKTIKKIGGKSGDNKSGGNKGGNKNNKSGGNQGGNKNKSGAQGQSVDNKTGNRNAAQAQNQTKGNKSKKSGGSNRSNKG